MATKYVNANFVFHRQHWADVLLSLPPQEYRAAQELSGLTISRWRQWTHPEEQSKAPHPGMQKFLDVCNLLQLDPRQFFTTE